MTAQLLFIMLSKSHGQEQVKLIGQIRYRYEISKRDFNKDTNPTSYNLLQTRAGLFYVPASDVAVFLQLQDSRILVEKESTLDGNAKRFDMHQAYLDIENLFHLPLALRLGRFESSFSNQRLIGAVGWNNAGRSFNGGFVAYHTTRGDITLFGYKINEQLNSGNEDDENFWGLWAALK